MRGALNAGIGMVGLNSGRVSFLDTNESSGVTDTFTAADSTDLNGRASDSGHIWTTHEGAFSISSNRATTDATGTRKRATVESEIANIYLTCTALSNSGDAAFVIRHTGADDYWLIEIKQAADTVKIWEHIAAGWAERASVSVTIDEDIEYIFTIIASDETITVYTAGANKISYASAAANKTVTTHGFYQFSGSSGGKYWDDLSITEYTGDEALPI